MGPAAVQVGVHPRVQGCWRHRRTTLLTPWCVHMTYPLLRTPVAPRPFPQTLLFSATLPSWVKQITNRFLKPDHVTVDLVGTDKMKVCLWCGGVGAFGATLMVLSPPTHHACCCSCCCWGLPSLHTCCALPASGCSCSLASTPAPSTPIHPTLRPAAPPPHPPATAAGLQLCAPPAAAVPLEPARHHRPRPGGCLRRLRPNHHLHRDQE